MSSFKTKAQVIEFLRGVSWLEETRKGGEFYRSGTYYLSHNEYERPSYFPRRYKDGWGVHIEYFFYAGTLHAPESGRVDIYELQEVENEW